MSEATFITGPSASGKGTRIKDLINYLDSVEEAEILTRTIFGNKDKSRSTTKGLGRLYRDSNVFVLGYYSKDGNSWQSLDQICMYNLSPLFLELSEMSLHVVCDMNVTLVNHPTIPRMLYPISSMRVVYFCHSDKEEALNRINHRRSLKGRSLWSLEDYEKSSVNKCNEKTERLFSRNDFSPKIKLDSKESLSFITKLII
jgi:hypothetical protein